MRYECLFDSAANEDLILGQEHPHDVVLSRPRRVAEVCVRRQALSPADSPFDIDWTS
jgi:hypothetical protein